MAYCARLENVWAVMSRPESSNLSPSAMYFELHGGGPDPEKETLAEYMERANKQGHWCCMCPKQNPPMPCCNVGHEEAVALVLHLEGDYQ